MSEVCDNGQLTADDIVRIVNNIIGVNNWAEGGPVGTGTMANGRVVPSPLNVISNSKMFKDAIAWTPTTLVTDALQTYTDSGILYAPQPSLLPFTTGGTFTASNWYVVQGLLPQDLGDLSIRTFATVADMVANSDNVVGDFFATENYLTPSVGGGALYKIVAPFSGTDDGGEFLDLASGNQAKLIPELHVKSSQFGCVGNGATDDTVQIQALLDAFSQVEIDTNSFINTTGITISTGSHWSIIISNLLDSDDGTMLTLDSVSQSEIIFTGEGQLVGGNGAGSVGIDLDNCVDITIDKPDMTAFNGASSDGVCLHIHNGSTYCRVVGGFFNGSSNGIVIEDSSTLHSIVDGSHFRACNHGLKILGSSYNKITNVQCELSSIAGALLQDKTGGCINNVFTSCSWNNGTGVSSVSGGIVVNPLVASLTAVPYDNVFIGQVCNGNASHGINFKSLADTVGQISGYNFNVISPICKNNTLSGIRLERANNIQITDAICKDNTVNGLTTEDCDDIQNSNGSFISNSVDGINHKSIRTIDSGCTTTFNARYGLIISDGVETSEEHIVRNCEISNNTSDDLLPSGTAGGNLKAMNCTGVVTDNRGVTAAQNATAITHGVTFPTGYTAANMIVIATPTTAGHIVTITSKTSTTFVISLVDDAGTAIVVNENINWEVHLY